MIRPITECPLWRWRPGMLAERWSGPCHGSYRYTDDDIRAQTLYVGGTPVGSDPATVGCLLALVREAWAPGIVRVVSPARADHTAWTVTILDAATGRPARTYVEGSEWDALCAALWAASERAP